MKFAKGFKPLLLNSTKHLKKLLIGCVALSNVFLYWILYSNNLQKVKTFDYGDLIELVDGE